MTPTTDSDPQPGSDQDTWILCLDAAEQLVRWHEGHPDHATASWSQQRPLIVVLLAARSTAARPCPR